MSQSQTDKLGFGADELATYLTQKGWVKDMVLDGRASIWHRVDDSLAEISVPSFTLRDYYARMLDALFDLQEFEGRDRESIRRDIVNAGAGLLTVRVKGEDTSEGLIPLRDGIVLIQKAKDLLVAAAMSLTAKKRHFQGRLADEMREYIDSVQLGQTEFGSYVINVVAPAKEFDLSEVASDEGIASVLFQNLVAGVEALHTATGASQGEVSRNAILLEQAVKAGASINMCDSLLGFSGQSRSRSFELSLSVPQGGLFPRRTCSFSFEQDRIAGLQAAIEYFRDDYVLRNRVVEGFVKHLSRPTQDEHGKITLEAFVEGVERSVNIELGPHDYHLGISAHDNKRMVRCSGDLHVKPRGSVLLNPSNFGFVNPDEALL
ncbi:hypothetical protein [Stenotrophomonas sp. PS02298]|uniref:hypothetical protein n=1 Tax=Stenotrophomonas sp. PS02298 TaxID=2991424 RepID=UPI00249B04C2|nr:hypothetical protein [Stenotrophomonas sp. PS02298]